MSLPSKRVSTEEVEAEIKRRKMTLRSLDKPGQEQQEAAVVAGRPDSGISVKMDSRVLECNICFEPLKPPVFQDEHLTVDPLVATSTLLGGVQLGKFFLLVPPELLDESTHELTINIRIDKINP